MVIDNTIKPAVFPLASNYVCASREFVLFLQNLIKIMPSVFCLWSRRVLLFKLIIIGYLYVGTESHDLWV